ncbi:MAG TPA: hypothetical protein VKX16_05445 [Chloroflexota bacterium]|nr:hypothetical protein [Chloroflexota bacterium]
MPQPLLPDRPPHADAQSQGQVSAGGAAMDMTDLRIFWGPEICRLEYLLHLLDTGRVKHDVFACSA